MIVRQGEGGEIQTVDGKLDAIAILLTNMERQNRQLLKRVTTLESASNVQRPGYQRTSTQNPVWDRVNDSINASAGEQPSENRHHEEMVQVPPIERHKAVGGCTAPSGPAIGRTGGCSAKQI